ncbi:MAG: type II restriction endonuclease [Clostridia bacterium]|nr:type II restriction endonuclease [Clostridia bacterium]
MSMTGSQIAKGGFANEQSVANKFNDWKNDKDAQQWLQIMMYDLDEIEYVHAEKIGQKGYKSDINVVIKIYIKKKHLETIENIQVKLVSSKDRGYNQVEKRKVEHYIHDWHISPEVETLLKLYDGELPPRPNSRNPKRMFVDEFTIEEQELLLNFFQKNLIMIISDVIRGRGRFAAEWSLIIQKYDDIYKWKLLAVNEVISIYADDCKASFTKQGNIRLGTITLQRKGGDKGADTANMLQFKANPLILF